jgi:hypothetical protein
MIIHQALSPGKGVKKTSGTYIVDFAGDPAAILMNDFDRIFRTKDKWSSRVRTGVTPERIIFPKQKPKSITRRRFGKPLVSNYATWHGISGS